MFKTLKKCNSELSYKHIFNVIVLGDIFNELHNWSYLFVHPPDY